MGKQITVSAEEYQAFKNFKEQQKRNYRLRLSINRYGRVKVMFVNPNTYPMSLSYMQYSEIKPYLGRIENILSKYGNSQISIETLKKDFNGTEKADKRGNPFIEIEVNDSE